MEERHVVWRVAANILNKHWRTADKESSSSLGELGEVLTTPQRKNVSCYETFIEQVSFRALVTAVMNLRFP